MIKSSFPNWGLMNINQDDEVLYSVVMNSEEQYSIWPVFKTVPQGWDTVGVSGSKDICLSHIKEVWTDMRPLSLRKKIKEAELKAGSATDNRTTPLQKEGQQESIVSFLERIQDHPVTVKPTNRNFQEFKESLARHYVHLTFTDTRGGTTVAVRLIPEKVNVEGENILQETGTVHFEGSFILDYSRMKCIAAINLKTFEGVCQVEVIERLNPFQALENSVTG